MGTIIGIMGLVTFSLFIFEESFQTIMFGTWPAQDAKDWELVLEGISLMESSNKAMKIVNYTFGYIQPLAFLSYRQYGIAADYYTKSLKAKVFANAPELFIGEEVNFPFRYKSYTALADGSFEARNRKMKVFLSDRPDKPKIRVSGTLMQGKNGFVVDMRN